MDTDLLALPNRSVHRNNVPTRQLTEVAITNNPVPRTVTLPSNGLPLSILLIDDDPGLRWLHRKALTTYGHHCSEAPDGITGLVTFQQLQPDLIILDIMMPELDGFAVLEAIRRQNTVVGVIMLSALAKPQGIQYARDAQADGYIRKPTTFQSLLQEVERVGNLVRLRR
jgi:DNA-binding response OmpR family regulator